MAYLNGAYHFKGQMKSDPTGIVSAIRKQTSVQTILPAVMTCISKTTDSTTDNTVMRMTIGKYSR